MCDGFLKTITRKKKSGNSHSKKGISVMKSKALQKKSDNRPDCPNNLVDGAFALYTMRNALLNSVKTDHHTV